MATNFQTDNAKHTKDRYDVYNPNFESPVGANHSLSFIEDNLDKWAELISFLRFYPDYFFDLIKEPDSKFQLDLDQRVYMRLLARMPSNYVCVTRGYSKTMVEVMNAYATASLFPGIKISMIAETKESSVGIWQPKHDEVLEFFPYLAECIQSANFAKDRGKVRFVNGSVVDNLGVMQGVKGQRRHRGNAEEDNLITKKTFDDAVLSVFDIARVVGPVKKDPEELNAQINKFTTSGKIMPVYVVTYIMNVVNLQM